MKENEKLKSGNFIFLIDISQIFFNFYIIGLNQLF